ncbi:thrombospondin type 1 domain containing lonely heart isoform X2 [Lycorma delicatula]|uniref:thrombospondin type 1 domain containing lonely heart isoform X2 n=1 Tax=Lycorma delicatula TaxID=130591 RepID=UPI003F5147A3
MYWPLRVVLAIWFLGVATRQEVIGSKKYPLQVHRMYRERVVDGMLGIWSQWSTWSECSRSCGGGITSQTRECKPRVEGRHKRKVAGGHCLGMYKRIHICNVQDCPPGSVDFRRVQCEQYNGKQFMGRAYTWEPFTDAGNECALNCRALGFRFYATLNSSVHDGTSCRPKEKDSPLKALCVFGVCKTVGCDGVVGSDKRFDTCGVCGGTNNTCRLVSGLFTRPQLPHGYNLITQIPRAACNISISHLKPTRNYFALRRNDGSFILNGNWAINWSGEYDAAGTKFIYRRDSSESITASGPLLEPVDLMLIYQQPNSGIKYQYQLPIPHADPVIFPPKDMSIAPPLMRHPAVVPSITKEANSKDSPVEASRQKPLFPYHNTNNNGILETDNLGLADEAVKPRTKGRRKKFSWKTTGFLECSRSCGGGIQSSVIVCVRDHNQAVVPERRCAGQEKPVVPAVRCNVKPCIAEWVGGEWSPCSVTCGEGVQVRDILCRQEITADLIMTVAEGACLTPPSPHLQRSRVCFLQPCSNSLPGSGMWFYTDWSQQCSEGCGTGVQTRKVHCSGGEGQCDLSVKPEDSRACSSDKQCGAKWFTGSWSQCSATCGLGRQTRNVVCIEVIGGHQQIVLDDNCRINERPALEQECQLQQCVPQWYTADWGICSKSCGTGVQKREVRCLDEHELYSTECSEQKKPAIRRSCNSHTCPQNLDDKLPGGPGQEILPASDSNHPGDQGPADHTASNDPNCTDKFHNCHLVVQARLCKYKYYRNSCCQACHNKA